MSVFSSGLITFWLRTPGRHWKKICHVTLMRWPVTAGRLHFCHVLVHQPWNRWYPRFFGAHQRQKTTPPKRGHFKITKWLEQIRPWILRFYPEDSGTKLDLNFSNSWFFFPPGKRGKTKKTTETRCGTLGFLASKFPGGKAGEGAYPGATPSRLPPTPQWSHETLNKRPRDVLPMRGEGLWRPNFWERPKKKIRAELFVGEIVFFFCGFGFLEDFWNLFWKSHTKVLKPRPKRFGSNLRRWFLQRKWRRFTFAQRYRRPRDSPFPHFNGVDFLGRSWSAGRNQRKRKGPKKLCKFWVEFVGCKWSELKPSKMTWRFQIFVKEMHQKPWKCLDDQHWFPKRCAQDWNQRSTSGS